MVAGDPCLHVRERFGDPLYLNDQVYYWFNASFTEVPGVVVLHDGKPMVRYNLPGEAPDFTDEFDRVELVQHPSSLRSQSYELVGGIWREISPAT
jgi:hypothetical protein